MITSKKILDYLNELYPDARCELVYTKDYELLMATVLSAQCTDKRVNMVTKELFNKYDLEGLAKADLKDIEKIIRPVGSFTRKAYYLKNIAQDLLANSQGIVPNNRDYLESLPGVGRKTCNVVLANIYNVPAIAVDTHVNRVAKRLLLSLEEDSVLEVEKKLMAFFPRKYWGRVHHQLVLFGRYKCKSLKPECADCKLQKDCNYYKKLKR